MRAAATDLERSGVRLEGAARVDAVLRFGIVVPTPTPVSVTVVGLKFHPLTAGGARDAVVVIVTT